MAGPSARRSRALISDGDSDTSRQSTPESTAAHDRKRMRADPELAANLLSPADAARPQRPRRPVTSRRSATPEERKFVLQPKRRHQPGAIVRVKLTNFVTYTSAEFYPGPNLNMVIGPNGTGKSTLVCAICLGLGWGPNLLGRAKDAAEYIKHGCKEATIEIELQRATSGPSRTGSNPVITRNIKKEGNKNMFYLDGRQTANKVIQEFVRGFNIQVDNLCQFLPQDRVVEFAQLGPVQRLETTLRAAADPEVLEYHERLKGLREEQIEFMSQNKGDREILQDLEKRQDAQRMDVERLEERLRIQKKINQLIKCRPLPKYLEAKNKAKELKDLKDKLTTETARLKQESAPAMQKVNAKQRYAAAAVRNRDDVRKEVKRAEGECSRLDREVSNSGQRVTDLADEHKATRDSSANDKQEYSRKQRELINLKASKEVRPAEFDHVTTNEKLNEYRLRIRQLTQDGEQKDEALQAARNQGREAHIRRKAAEEKLNSLSTEEGRREDKLASDAKDTADAWRWIKENQQMFKMEVFGPPAVTCSVKDPRMADAIESLMNQGDFRAITVQCMDDFRLIQEELTKKKNLFELTVRKSDEHDLSRFRSLMSYEELSNLGLEGWAIDYLEGPSVVLAMLCQSRQLHQTATTSKKLSEEQDKAIGKSSIKNYVTKDKFIKVFRREDYGVSTTQTSDIKPARWWTDEPVDTQRREEHMRDLKREQKSVQSYKEQVEQLKTEIERIKEERLQEESARNKLAEEKEAAQRAQAAYNGIGTKIQRVEDRLRVLEGNMATVKERCHAIARQKDEEMLKKAQNILEYCEVIHSLKEASQKLLEAEIIAIEAQSDFQTLERLHSTLRDTLKQKESQLNAASKEHEVARQSALALKSSLEEVRQEAETLSEEEDDNSLFELLQSLAMQRDLTEQTLEDMIDAENAKLGLTDGGINAANVIREYEERAKKIEKLQTKLRDYNKKQDEYISSIKTIRESFEADLQSIIEKIDAAFAESFERIGCAGQVKVHKASSEDPADCTEELGGQENGLDFANWAIHILVKFREKEPLSLLDSHRQSGGERAVSTIFYLMALQSLSKSPFRVVDEINQGMDQRNERMVHGRMVDIAAANERAVAQGQANGSQYFLITPKLLSGLKYEKGMTVLCVVSGENVPSATDVRRTAEGGNEYTEKGRKFDFAAFAGRARQLGLGRLPGGEGRMDSRASMRGVSVSA